MNNPFFSVITPVHLWCDQRVEMFLKTIESLKNQTFRDFEWVVVDDGSTVDFRWELLSELDFPVTLIHRVHEERVISYNEAFKLAKGEWFTLLDSDDEYKSSTLERLKKEITRYPEDKMFNFGAVYAHKDGTYAYRDPFTPKREKVGHEKFGGGNIVNGTFIWHHSVYDALGAYGPKGNDGHVNNVDTTELNYGGERNLYLGSPYDFSAWAQLEFPEIREYFFIDRDNEPLKAIKELGNPWGQDYFLYYKYTRKYFSRVFKEYLYIVNSR